MNWNLFKRIDNLELDNMHLNVLLKGARADIDTLRTITREQSQWLSSLQSMVTPKPKAAPKPKVVKPKEVMSKAALNAAFEKRKAYARAYAAKKRAEKKTAAAGVAA